MKPLNFRDLSDPLKIKYIKEWQQKPMTKLLEKLKHSQDITVGFIADPCELEDR